MLTPRSVVLPVRSISPEGGIELQIDAFHQAGVLLPACPIRADRESPKLGNLLTASR